jgi:hypothetical protein
MKPLSGLKSFCLGTALLVPGIIPTAASAQGNAIGVAHTQRAESHMLPPGYDCRDCGQPDGVAAPNPPANFNPLTASDDEIAFFGFPPRPDANKAPDAYAFWKKLVTSPARRIQPILRATRIKHGPAKNVSIAEPNLPPKPTGATSTNWSGYVVQDNNNPFKAAKTYIYGILEVPVARQAFGTCNGTWDYSSPWVGIDGWGSNDVLQSGIDADAYCSGGTTATNYDAWYEWYPAGVVILSNFPVAPGDVIYVYVWPTSTTVGNYYILNVTQNVSSSIQFNAPNGTTLVGNTLDWITEWFAGPMITNYLDIPWAEARAVLPGGTQYSPGKAPTGTVYSITLEDGSGNQLSKAYLTPNNALTYVDPNNKTHTDTGSTLWFQTEGLAR